MLCYLLPIYLSAPINTSMFKSQPWNFIDLRFKQKYTQLEILLPLFLLFFFHCFACCRILRLLRKILWQLLKFFSRTWSHVNNVKSKTTKKERKKKKYNTEINLATWKTLSLNQKPYFLPFYSSSNWDKKKPNLLKIFPCQMLILLGYLMRVAQVFRGKFFQLFFFFWFQTLMHCRLEVALLCGRNDRNFLFGSLFRFSYKYNSLYIFPRTISVPQSPQISLSFTLGKIWYLGMGNIRGKIFMHILAQIRGYCNCYPS